MRALGLRKLSGLYLAGAVLVSATLTGCPQPVTIDYHTQIITPGENELEGRMLYFMPDGSLNFYSRTVIDGISSFPVTPETGEVVDFTEGDPFRVALPNDLEILYYGRTYDTLFIGSDGTVSLGEAGEGNSSLSAHFSTPQVSLLPVDADQGNGTVTYEIFSNEVVVTFANVLVGTTSNSFQVEFFISGAEDGDLALSYPVASQNVGGLVGLSNGQLAGSNQAQIDAFLAEFVPSNLTEENTGTAKLGS